MAYPIYEVINEYKLPVIFHTGHSGMGTGMRGGGGMRLKYGEPMLIDDVAVDFPDMKIILAHPSWPWVDQSLSHGAAQGQRVHRPSRLEPEVLPQAGHPYANTQLKHKMLFGSDFPLIHPDKWIKAAARTSASATRSCPAIMKDNAAKVLGLT